MKLAHLIGQCLGTEALRKRRLGVMVSADCRSSHLMSHCVTKVPVWECVVCIRMATVEEMVRLNMRAGSDGWVVLKRDEMNLGT